MAINLDSYSPDDYSSDECEKDGCRTVVTRNVGVRTPVEIDVKTRTGDIKIVCSKPSITEDAAHSDNRRSKCEFTINQCISVEIPVSYRVRTDVKSSYVDCDVDGE